MLGAGALLKWRPVGIHRQPQKVSRALVGTPSPPCSVRVSRYVNAHTLPSQVKWAAGEMLISRGCLPWREEPSRWPLQDRAWLPVHFAAFHVVRGSSWEQMTQQPESLRLSGLSAF